MAPAVVRWWGWGWSRLRLQARFERKQPKRRGVRRAGKGWRGERNATWQRVERSWLYTDQPAAQQQEQQHGGSKASSVRSRRKFDSRFEQHRSDRGAHATAGTIGAPFGFGDRAPPASSNGQDPAEYCIFRAEIDLRASERAFDSPAGRLAGELAECTGGCPGNRCPADLPSRVCTSSSPGKRIFACVSKRARERTNQTAQ